MDPKPAKRPPPEHGIRTKLVELMERRGWYVKIIHGNAYTNGLPDIFAAHIAYGMRWIEVKHADSYHFTDGQKREFPKMCAKNVGIWIVALKNDPTDAQVAYEYENVVVNGPPNWTKYWSHSRRPY